MDYRVPRNLLVVTEACPTAHRAWRKDIRVEQLVDRYLAMYGRYDTRYLPEISMESIFHWISGAHLGGRFFSYDALQHWKAIDARMHCDHSSKIVGQEQIISFSEYRRQIIRAIREIVRNYRKTVRKYARV